MNPHNDECESVFGHNDWLTKLLPNLAQATRSVVLEVNYNKTMDWLKEQQLEKRKAIVALAQSQRQCFREERKEERHLLLEYKIAKRKKMVAKGVEKQMKMKNEIEKLKSDPLISSVDLLNERVAMVNSLSLPPSVKEAELRALVKRQTMLRFMVFHQKHAKVVLTERGRRKSSLEVLKELAIVIKNSPLSVQRKDQSSDHQLLFTLFDKPTLLIGVKLIHRFEDEESLEQQWYHAKITSYKKKLFNVYYPATKENYAFTVDELKEDFLCGDLKIE